VIKAKFKGIDDDAVGLIKEELKQVSIEKSWRKSAEKSAAYELNHALRTGMKGYPAMTKRLELKCGHGRRSKMMIDEKLGPTISMALVACVLFAKNSSLQ
jgi:hypothetical protein